LPNVIDTREDFALFDSSILSTAQRETAFERFRATPSGREKPGRYWKIDLESLDLHGAPSLTKSVTFENVPPRVVACDLRTAAREYPEIFQRVFGTVSDNGKFSSLARAFAQVGAFIHVPPDISIDEPITIRYNSGIPNGAMTSGQSFFPYTIVVAEHGSQVTIIERLEFEDQFVCGAVELLAKDGAHITYTSLQKASETTQIIMTRAARCERNAHVTWAIAELGSALSVGSIDTAIAGEGSHVDTTAIFFPNAQQHVDLLTSVEHNVGHATSETLVKSAATDRGQGRYLGNIRIVKDAQGSEARLKDDALLLSKNSHIDSVPALEIAANDVKAFHGATVGAIDTEQIFYMETRGIPREAAEKMISLGFFEPAIDRFPTIPLQEEIRTALTAKLT